MQYEDSFRELYADVRSKLQRIPKRRRNTVAKPVMDRMNAAFKLIMCIDEDPVRGTTTAPQRRYNLIVSAQNSIKAVEPALYAWWNICDDIDETDMKEWRAKQRANLCEQFNYVLKLLHDMQMASSRYQPEGDKGQMLIMYYTEKEIQKAEFLRKIQALHKMTHGKVVRMNEWDRSAEGSVLIELVDTAWYCAVHGNKMRLSDPAERTLRKALFSKAISALNKMQRPMFNMMSIGDYSNSEMRDWIRLLRDSIRMLYAVQKSDIKRAG